MDIESNLSQHSSQLEVSNDEMTSDTGSIQKGSVEYYAKDMTEAVIERDKKYHSKAYLMTLGLLDREMKKVIDPCLDSAEIQEDIRIYLQEKRKELESLQKKLVTMFSGGQLNPEKYLLVIDKMSKANLELLKELKNEEASEDIARLQKRLQVLAIEKEKFQEKVNKEAASADSAMKASVVFSKIERSSPEELLQILQSRVSQYWSLANYLNDRVMDALSPEEKDELKQRLETVFLPLINRASQYMKQLEAGEKNSEITAFLRKEMVELSPNLLHGKSLTERAQDLQGLIEQVEECNREEESFTNILKAAMDDPDQRGGILGKKVKEVEGFIEQNNKYIEYLSKLGANKFQWVPTPKVVISKEQRLVSLVNAGIPGNTLQVEFKKLTNIPRGYYWIRWGIETQDGYSSFETDYCDFNSSIFQHRETIEMTSKTRMDPSLDKKEIRVEVLYKMFKFFKECTYCEGIVSLADFSRTNTIDEKLKLNNSDAQIHYVLKIRQPLSKSTTIGVNTVHTFHTFSPFSKNSDGQSDASSINSQNSFTSKPVSRAKTIGNKSKPNDISFTTSINTNTIPLAQQVLEPSTKHNILPASTIQEEKMVPEKPVKASTSFLQSKQYPPIVLLKNTNDPLASITEQEVPEGLSMAEVIDPAEPDRIESITVLKNMVEQLQQARADLAFEGRKADNKLVSENWTKAFKKSSIMEAKFGEGEVDPEEYLVQLKQGLGRDYKLVELYKNKQDESRLAFINEKIRIIEGEVKEIEEGLA